MSSGPVEKEWPDITPKKRRLQSPPQGSQYFTRHGRRIERRPSSYVAPAWSGADDYAYQDPEILRSIFASAGQSHFRTTTEAFDLALEQV
jgi:hypothetical protein